MPHQQTSFGYFVILGEMRTGSNLLQERLNQFDGITCHGEMYNPVFINTPRQDTHLGITYERRLSHPMALLDAMRAQPGLNGFRLFSDHDPRMRSHVLADRSCAKIVLTRNPLESHVSRKIAAATDQWKLNNIARRRQAQVSFDAHEFEQYLAQVQATQLEIQRALQVGGQSAFYINYEDLADIDVLNGLAAWLGVTSRIDVLSQGLKKQNPEPLEEKLTNPQDLAPGLARIDRFDLGRTPCFEPRRRPMLNTMVAARRTPLLFMPVRGAPEARITAWLAALDGVEQADLPANFDHTRLQAWRRTRSGARSFTVLRHPVHRACSVFLSRVLPGGVQPVRRQMERQFAAAWPAPGTTPDAQALRALFLAFLRFARASLSGQTAMQPWPFWASQTAQVEAMTDAGGPDYILREDTLQHELASLAAVFGHASPPPVPTPADDPRIGLIVDDETQAEIEACYRRDYDRFGFTSLRG
ncbi:MAG: nodulation protein NodH [Pararhodobacter sp.]